MSKPTYKELLDAGVHFGHMKRKWNPKMSQYIFTEKRGIHIIDLNKTLTELDKTANAMKDLAKSGKKIMFVATKKQGSDIVRKAAESVNMPFVTHRWLGGMLTNFSTIRKSIKKMERIESMLKDKTLTSITKKERLTLEREKNKLEKVLGGIRRLNRIPAAMYVVDIAKEHLAIKEAQKLNLRTFAMVDTNVNPNDVDFAIPANDDSTKSIEIITNYLTNAIKEGLEEKASKKEEKEAASEG
ncbi:MAG TPA: 30S ribosomal protein S2 [Bacteroidetes bacterium]|nr:30S ribosomal protein S2 [Bacteroidota bacterium]